MPLGRAGQFQPHHRQASDGLLTLGFDALPSFLHQFPGVIVKFGGGGERAAILSGTTVRQFLAQRDVIGLAVNGLVNRRFLRWRLTIRRRCGGEQKDQREGESSSFNHGFGCVWQKADAVQGAALTLYLMVHFFWFDLADNTTSFSVMATIL